MRELRRLLGYLGPYRRDLLIAAVMIILETAFEMVIPVLMADIIDVGVANRDVAVILQRGIQMGVCALLALATGLLYARFTARAAYGWGANIREAQFERVQKYAFSNLDKFETSSLVTRMTTDVTVLQNTVNGGYRPLVRSPVMLVMGVGLSFWMNPRLALVFLVCAPVLGGVLFVIVRRVAPMYGRLQKAVDRLNNVVQEGLTAIRAVKAFVRGEYEEEKFQGVNSELMETSQRTFRLAVLNLPVFQLVMYTAVVLIMWLGGNMVLNSGLQVGQLTGFLSYVLQVMNSMMLISNVFLLLTRSLASARRISEVLDENIVLDSPEDAVEEVPDGSVEFEGVSFKYHSGAREYALSGVELHIGRADGGHPGRYWLGQDYPGAAHSQAVRRHRGDSPGGRPGCAGVRSPGSAGRGGHRAPEERSLLRHRAGESEVGETGRERRGAVGGLSGGLRRRISGADAKGPGHRPGPGRRERLRRAEAAAVHRPYPAQAAENPDLRRLHQRRGHRH